MATAPQHITTLASMNHDVAAWVDAVAKLTLPRSIYWCDGSDAEFAALERELAAVTRQRDILKKALAILGQEPNNSTR